jgi:hypothetical protein
MAENDSTNATPAPQMGQAEMQALAERPRNRAASVLFKDQPEQGRDLEAAASIIMANVSLIRRLAHLQAELRRAADATEDEATERHLRDLLGGA